MYTKVMKRHIQRSLPPEFFAEPAYLRALALGLVYLFLAITQLCTYEKFSGIIEGYKLPGGSIVVVIVAGLLPLLEIAALPFLISMRVSARTRSISRLALLAAPILWLLISLWLVFTADM